MFRPKLPLRVFYKGVFFSTLLMCSLISSNLFLTKSYASPGMFELQWDADPSFKKLKTLQTSNEKMDRATYYLFLRSSERKTGILQITVKLPDYFDAALKEKKISLCEVKIGGFQDKTRCVNKIPAVIEVGKDQTSIDVFPDSPIPVDNKAYAVVIKLFNPRSSGMYQFHGYAKSTGAMDASSYIGSWTFDVK